MTLPPCVKKRQWISHKNDEVVKFMIKTQILLWKAVEGSGRLRVKFRFILFYSEFAPADLWCNMLQTLLGWKKYEEAMSDEHPPKVNSTAKQFNLYSLI